MKPALVFNTGKVRPNRNVFECFLLFSIVLAFLLFIDISIKTWQPFLFQFLLFFTGWVTWTFGEYMAHRYLMHTANKEKSKIDFNHLHHHSHPAEIRISGKQRLLLVISSFSLLFMAAWMNNYFTIVAGFLCGFPGYTLMHYLLHQKITQKFFRKLVKYHVYHHCKYPDKCFGISVTWWDDLFGTIPEKILPIPQRIIDFYFNDKPIIPILKTKK